MKHFAKQRKMQSFYHKKEGYWCMFRRKKYMSMNLTNFMMQCIANVDKKNGMMK